MSSLWWDQARYDACIARIRECQEHPESEDTTTVTGALVEMMGRAIDRNRSFVSFYLETLHAVQASTSNPEAITRRMLPIIDGFAASDVEEIALFDQYVTFGNPLERTRERARVDREAPHLTAALALMVKEISADPDIDGITAAAIAEGLVLTMAHAARMRERA